MSAAAVHTPDVHTHDAQIRSHYEESLAWLQERCDPNSPGYNPAHARCYAAQAKTFRQLLADLDETREAEPAPVVPPTPEFQQREPQPHERWPRQQGRFTVGNPGGPGRPPKIRYVEHDMVAVVANAISPLDLHELTQVAVALAKTGNNNAFRWLNQMLFRHSRTSINQTAALQASGLSDDEHRWVLAEQHFGKAMEKAGIGGQGSGVGEEDRGQGTEMPAVSETRAVTETPDEIPEQGIAQPVAEPVVDRQVVEVRLAPRRESERGELPRGASPRQAPSQPAADSATEKNGNKRSKTVENGRLAAAS